MPEAARRTVMEAYQDRVDCLPADRRELLTLWLAQEDDRAAVAGRAPYAEPRTPVESSLARLCLPGQPSQRLFDSILVIENFPAHVTEGAASQRLAVSNVRADIDEGYPVVLEVRPGPPVEFKIRHGIRPVGAQAASGLLASLLAYVRLIAKRGPRAAGVPLDEITIAMAEAAARQAEIAQAQRVAAQRRRLLGARRQPAGSGAAHYGGTDS